MSGNGREPPVDTDRADPYGPERHEDGAAAAAMHPGHPPPPAGYPAYPGYPHGYPPYPPPPYGAPYGAPPPPPPYGGYGGDQGYGGGAYGRPRSHHGHGDAGAPRVIGNETPPDVRLARKTATSSSGSTVADVLARLTGGGSVAAAAAASLQPPPPPATAPPSTVAPRYTPTAGYSVDLSKAMATSAAPPTSVASSTAPPSAAAGAAGGETDLKALVQSIAASMGGSMAGAGHPKELLELYVGGMPEGATGEQMRQVINTMCNQLHLYEESGGPDPAVSVRHTLGQRYCFIMFRSPEDATKAMGLATVPNFPLRVARPSGYVAMMGTSAASAAPAMPLAGAGGLTAGGSVPMAAPLGMGVGASTGVAGAAALRASKSVKSAEGAASSAMDSSSTSAAAAAPSSGGSLSHTIELAPLGPAVDAEGLRQVMEPFGALSRCEVDESGPVRRGLLEFANPATTDVAVTGISGQIDLGAGNAVARRLPLEDSAKAPGAAVAVRILHAATEEDIGALEDLDMLIEEMREEMSKVATVKDVLVAVRDPREEGVAGAVPVYALLASEKGARAVARFLHGRDFDGRSVVAETTVEQELADVRSGGLDARSRFAPPPPETTTETTTPEREEAKAGEGEGAAEEDDLD